MTPLTTDRLIIRTLTDADDPAFERTLNDVQKTCLGSGKGFLDWLIQQYETMDIINGLICFGMFDKQTGTLVGTIGAGRHDDLHEPELFYFTLPEYRNLGLTTEAAKAVTQWALDGYDIPYIIGTAAVDNPASQRVLEKSGYRYIDTRTLLVHALQTQYAFRYYRYERQA